MNKPLGIVNEIKFEDCLCSGCLSADRRSSVALKNELDVFYNVLGVQQQYSGGRIVLCWECRAMLRKFQVFQTRIQHAQHILQQSLSGQNNLPITTLSTLTLTNILNDDFPDVNHHSKATPINHESKTTNTEENTFPVEIKQELPNEVKLNTPENDDTSATQAEESQEPSDDEDGNDNFSGDNFSDVEETKLLTTHLQDKRLIGKKTLAKSWSNTILRYESKAQVSERKTTKKNHTSVVLTEMEIEEVMKRYQKRYGYAMKNKCKDCKDKFMKLIDLRRHQTFNHIDTKKTAPSRCLHCKVAIASWEDMKLHWRKHNRFLKCNQCEYMTQSPPMITKHQKFLHTYTYSCKECDATCGTLREFGKHYKESHEKMICDHCNKVSYNRKAFVAHMKYNHLFSLFCKECNVTSKNRRNMLSHMALKHPHLIGADTSKDLRYCVECDMEFVSVTMFKKHLANSSKHGYIEKRKIRCPCPQCGKLLTKNCLKNHIDRFHSGSSKHYCDICDKSLVTAYSLRFHRSQVHEKMPLPKNKICDICGRGFFSRRTLENHRRTHTGERPFKCAHCPAAFAQVTAMKSHEKTQHKQ